MYHHQSQGHAVRPLFHHFHFHTHKYLGTCSLLCWVVLLWFLGILCLYCTFTDSCGISEHSAVSMIIIDLRNSLPWSVATILAPLQALELVLVLTGKAVRGGY